MQQTRDKYTVREESHTSSFLSSTSSEFRSSNLRIVELSSAMRLWFLLRSWNKQTKTERLWEFKETCNDLKGNFQIFNHANPNPSQKTSRFHDILQLSLYVEKHLFLSVLPTLHHISAWKNSVCHWQKTLTHRVFVMKINLSDSQTTGPKLQWALPRKTASVPLGERLRQLQV